MQLEQRSIPFEKIETNVCGFHNPRTYLGDVSDIKKSIEEEGLLVNPTVWEAVIKGKTHYVVLLGHRRMEAIRQIRQEAEESGEAAPPFDDVVCSVTEVDLEGAMSIALIDHVHNETLNPADTAQAVAKLVEKTGNQTKVGEMLAKSQPWVSIYLNLYRGLIPAALEALRVGNIKVNQAKKLAAMLNQDKTPDIGAQEAALERIIRKEPVEKEGEDAPRKRTKTYRSKKEVEALRVRMAELDKENGEVDAEYRAVISKVVKWYFCQIDDEEISFSSADLDVKEPQQQEEEETVEAAPAPKKKKRRIANVAAV